MNAAGEWVDVKDGVPSPGTEVMVLVDGHRGPAWRNNHMLIAYIDHSGAWREERHPGAGELVGVIGWAPVNYPE